MDGDEPHSEHLAQAWVAAETSSQAPQLGNNFNQFTASTSNMANNIGNFGTATATPATTSQPPPLASGSQLPPFESAIPQRRRLPSYVSEPPSTLLALSMMAEEEAAAHEKANLDPSPFSTTPMAASAAQENNQRNLKSEMTLRQMAWMHTSPEDATTNNNKNTVFGRSHAKLEAGDLAGAELRHRRRPPPIRLTSLNAPRSLSPSRTNRGGSVRSAGTANGNPKTRVSNIENLYRRRDADVLFVDSKSDNEDDDSSDTDSVKEGKGKGAGSPRSDGHEGKVRREKLANGF